MLEVKATKISKIQSVLQDFPEEFMKSPNNELYCNLCSCTISCNKRCLAKNHRNAFKHQKVSESSSELLILNTLQTLSRNSNNNFVEKVAKAFLSADISLYKQNYEHINNQFHDIGHSLPSETTCRKAVLQLSGEES